MTSFQVYEEFVVKFSNTSFYLTRFAVPLKKCAKMGTFLTPQRFLYENSLA